MRLKYLFIMIGTISLVACGAKGDDIRTSGEGALLDKTWVLTSYGVEEDMKEVLQGTEITAVFIHGEAEIRGSAGCNHYFGNYEVTGNEITLDNIGSTEMYCITPEGVMEQEQLFLSVLAAVRSFQIHDQQLIIFSAGDQILMFDVK